ncbi:MAG: hypothetical protein Q9M40_02795 [Sulfurimonas sp.]|nr:hypothetical protein [Sulfurimonas sp.]
MTGIKKLTNEYASNLICNFIGINNVNDKYYNMFKTIFKECKYCESLEIIDSSDLILTDIVFIELDKGTFLKEYKNLKQFMQIARYKNDFLRIYLIQDSKHSRVEEMNLWYEFDGSLPSAFDRENTYLFLYRMLQRVTAEKALGDYIKILENQLFSPYEKLEEKTAPVLSNKKKIAKRDSTKEKDLRFTQVEKISAAEFINSLDDTIIDKVESFTSSLDSLIGDIYEMESLESADAIGKITLINEKIKDIEILIASMFVFPIIERAFFSLNEFLSNLTVEDIEAKKNLLVSVLIGIINDLEKWINVIFVAYKTEDIHYFDASFSSNILELENIFKEEELEEDMDEEDDDLEFF